MTYPILDLYSCAGGAAAGYARAGLTPFGVDQDEQPRYPFAFHRGDAIRVLRALRAGYRFIFVGPEGERETLGLSDFVAIHASPPCQTFSRTRTLHAQKHPDLVEPTRDALRRTGLPYVIENVVGAPLLEPLKLCGTEFGMTALDVDGVPLKLVRHRLFESNIPLVGNGGCRHDRSVITASVYGEGGGWTPAHRDNPARRGGYIPHTRVVQELLGIDWMTKHEMSQVVPPVMAEHIGKQIIEHVRRTA